MIFCKKKIWKQNYIPIYHLVANLTLLQNPKFEFCSQYFGMKEDTKGEIHKTS